MAGFKFQNFNPDICFDPKTLLLAKINPDQAIPHPLGAFQEPKFHALWDIASRAHRLAARIEVLQIQDHSFETIRNLPASDLYRILNYIDDLLGKHISVKVERNGYPEWTWLNITLDPLRVNEQSYEVGDDLTVLPHQLFAALALRTVDKAITAARRDDYFGEANFSTYAIEATESLLFANRLDVERDQVIRKKQETEDRMRKTIYARHAKTTYKLRQKAYELYFSGKWRSVRQAAKSIYPRVAEYALTIDTRLSKDRGERTVYDWLLEFNKAATSASRSIPSTT